MRGARDGAGERAIEAVLHAVGIHGGEQDFARAERLAARGPLDGVDAFVVAAAARVDVPAAGRVAARVDGQHHGLRAEFLAQLGDQLGPAHGGGVDADLVGAGHAGCGARRPRERMPPPTVSGMKTLRAVRATTSAMMSRASLEAVMSRKTSSSAPCSVVAVGQFHRIAGIAQVDEVDALDHAAAGDVETGNDALGEHR